MKNKNIILFAIFFTSVFLISSLNLASATGWQNQTDGISVLVSGSGVTNPHGLTSNGTDLFFVDVSRKFLNHLGSAGQNMSDGFNLAPNCNDPRGLCMNSTTFILVSDTSNKVCYYGLDGSFKSQGLNVNDLTGSAGMNSVGCNETDLWLSASGVALFHVGSDGNEIVNDRFDPSTILTCTERGIVVNSTDIWVVCGVEHTLARFSLQGSLRETIDLATMYGSTEPADLCRKPNIDFENTAMDSLWISEQNFNMLFHIENIPPVTNNAPYITFLDVTPQPAYVNDTLYCTANYNDADLDKGNITISWYNGSSLYQTTNVLNKNDGDSISDTLSLPYQVFLHEGETWNCSMIPTDAQGLSGNMQSETKTISRISDVISGCGTTISYAGDYILDSNLSSSDYYTNCITVNAPYVSIDCAGHSITNTYGSPTGAIGIRGNSDRLNVSNCQVLGDWGIGIGDMSGGTPDYQFFRAVNNVVIGSDTGIYVDGILNSLIEGNIIDATSYGIGIYVVNNSIITRNIINSANIGINLQYYTIHYNFFNYIYDNSITALTDANIEGTLDPINYWNTTNTSGINIIGTDGIGGNFWSSYTGRSKNYDFFGDTPFILSANNRDYLPLVLTNATFSIPQLNGIDITPRPANSLDTLNCSAFYTDEDLKKANITASWYNGSTLFSSTTFSNINSDTTISYLLSTGIQNIDEMWNCTMTAIDEENKQVSASSIITIGNTPPEIVSVTLNSPLTTSTQPNCSVLASDIEDTNLQVNITFLRNDVVIYSLMQNTTSNSLVSYTIPAQGLANNVTCRAYAYDFKDYSNSIEDSEIVQLATSTLITPADGQTINSESTITLTATTNFDATSCSFYKKKNTDAVFTLIGTNSSIGTTHILSYTVPLGTSTNTFKVDCNSAIDNNFNIKITSGNNFASITGAVVDTFVKGGLAVYSLIAIIVLIVILRFAIVKYRENRTTSK